ncbi:MAG: hypothetical protein ACI8YO_002695 [Gammaproteobacteria bacterium]|jgi:hypothetical protein
MCSRYTFATKSYEISDKVLHLVKTQQMKFLTSLLLLISVFVFCSINAQITIGDPISVTNDDNSFSYRTPKVEINGNGEPVVLWVKQGSLEELYISRKSGSSFTEPVSIPLGGINPNIWSANLGPGLAVHENHVYVVFEKYGEAIYLSHSDDYGDTWDDPIAAFTPPTGRVASIPNVAVGIDGNPLVSYVNTNQSEEDAHYGLVKSLDFGATFSAEVQVNTAAVGSEVCECCNGDVAVSENGDIYVAFRNNNENVRDCWIARSVDGGENFTLAYDMDETDWLVFACPSNGPNIFVDDNKAVVTFYTAATGWDNGAYYTALDLNSSEIGSTISVPQSSESSSNQTAPRVAGEGDIIGVVTQETISGTASIAMSISFEGPTGLQNESFQLFESNQTQRYPAVAFHDNRFHVVYEHSQTGTVYYQEVYVGPLSIDDYTETPIIAYPNPASNELFITGFDHAVDVTVIDISGNRILTKKVASNSSLSLTNLDNGIYFAEINDYKNIRTIKITVMR